MNKLILNAIIILAGISLLSFFSNTEQPEVKAQPAPWAFSEVCKCGDSCQCAEPVAKPVAAPQPAAPATKLVWRQDCSSGNTCTFVQVRVPVSDSRPEVGSSGSNQMQSTQRTGLFRRLFRRR